MKQTFFTLDNRTNMHVGSGQSNYGVIDNLVQRDPTYQHPVIHASSLKGGIKEYCHHHGFSDLRLVFGSEKENGKTKHDTSGTGAYKFFDAMLLCMPVRCDKRAYVHITCPDILGYLHDSLPTGHAYKADLVNLNMIFSGSTEKAYCFSLSLDGATIEDFDIKAKFEDSKARLLTPNLKSLLGAHEIAIVTNDLFTRLTNDLHLPVIARNYLENGESKNLWYEQVVPRLSRFWGQCLHPEEQDDALFNPVLFNENVLVQIGANGSVGYGYCSFRKFQS